MVHYDCFSIMIEVKTSYANIDSFQEHLEGILTCKVNKKIIMLGDVNMNLNMLNLSIVDKTI